MSSSTALSQTGGPSTTAFSVIQAEQISDLISALAQRGFDVIGPTIRDGAIVLDQITCSDDLPKGWTTEQEPGHYLLKTGAQPAFFAYGVGPQSWKKYLHPADLKLSDAVRDNGTFRILNGASRPVRPYAFLGVRPCELAAIVAQDRVLLGDKYKDPNYEARRHDVFIVVVQCTQSTPTCFCASLGTGPQASTGFDIALTEVIGSKGHRFLAQSGSARGAQLLNDCEPADCDEVTIEEAALAVQSAARQSRTLDVVGLRKLHEEFENPHWEEVAQRCLACGNCTMVCPTCFCTTVEDTTDVSGNHAERWRRWDSCFTQSFSYIHGGSVRASTKSRYRQWMTHKFSSWVDQFGSLGCVGCGRCITWCPAKIDITEEARAFQEAATHGIT